MRMLKRCIIIIFCSVVIALFYACNPAEPGKGAFLRVDKTRCTACEKCVVVCDADAITIIGNKAVIDPSKCIECGDCVIVCPEDAID